MNIGIVAIEYPIETCSAIKNLSTYLRDKKLGGDIIIHNLDVDNNFKIEEVKIYNLKSPMVELKRFNLWKFNALLNNLRLLSFSYRLQKSLLKYDYLFAFEAKSLTVINRSGYPLDKVIYWFLENTNIVTAAGIDFNHFSTLLSKSKKLIIQSRERGDDVNNDLNKTFKFEYVPISGRPLNDLPIKMNNVFKIIYSGYICEWSMLIPIVNALINLKFDYHLTIRGHFIGTEYYLNDLKKLIFENNLESNITIETNYLTDEEHSLYLTQFDCALGLYKITDNTSNWRNLIFTSGKISTYLWAGLPIITNVCHELTKKEPFFYIENVNETSILNAFTVIHEENKLYKKQAFITAHKYYNFDNYIDTIIPLLNYNS
jgi:hypothetical protein